MMATSAVRTALVTSALALLSPATLGWAQVIPRQSPGEAAASTESSGAMTTTVIIGLVVAMVVVVAVLAKIADLRRKRETEAVVLQSRLSDAILRDPSLFSFPITPTAHVPVWTGSPATVEVAGQVPSEDVRQAALRLIEREASQVRPDVHIESRIGVVPTMVQRPA